MANRSMAYTVQPSSLSVINICPAGDLLLETKDDLETIKAVYRVNSADLVRHCTYFDKLFSSDFSDGVQYRADRARLDTKYGSGDNHPSMSELPKAILSFPSGFVRVPVILKAFKLFLQAVHGGPLENNDSEPKDWLLTNFINDIDAFAHAVAIADQLDASHVLEHVAQEILKIQSLCNKKPQPKVKNSERYWRQCLYIAYVHKHSEAFKYTSGAIIWHGINGPDDGELDAPWMNLPDHIEEEMAIRREGIYNTIASVPNALLRPYMLIDHRTKLTICKRGWSHSPACDCFQLGETIRWLCRKGLASPSVNMAFAVPDDNTDTLDKNPKRIIKDLREFPNYQIDEHHSRCGIKGKLMQILAALEKMLFRFQRVGLCLECCQSPGSKEFSWSQQHQPNSVPYTGNLLKDIAAVERYRTLMAAKREREAQSKGQPLKNTARGLDNGLGSVSIDATTIANNDMAERLPGFSTTLPIRGGSKFSGQAAVASIQQSNKILRRSQIETSTTSNTGSGTGSSGHIASDYLLDSGKCPDQAEHRLYARVFAPERWTEKEWLTGDEE